MKLEKLEKAKELQSQIEFLKKKIKSFDPTNRYVYLNVSDQYGNKRDIIETYAFNDTYIKATSYSFENVISDAYAKFLETVRDEMQKRIDYLQNELDSL